MLTVCFCLLKPSSNITWSFQPSAGGSAGNIWEWGDMVRSHTFHPKRSHWPVRQSVCLHYAGECVCVYVCDGERVGEQGERVISESQSGKSFLLSFFLVRWVNPKSPGRSEREGRGGHFCDSTVSPFPLLPLLLTNLLSLSLFSKAV